MWVHAELQAMEGAQECSFRQPCFCCSSLLEIPDDILLAVSDALIWLKVTDEHASGNTALRDLYPVISFLMFASLCVEVQEGGAGMILESVNRCDVDIRRELLSGIVLTGMSVQPASPPPLHSASLLGEPGTSLSKAFHSRISPVALLSP